MAESVQLKCKHCGGTLTVDDGREVLVCPFCGEKELMVFNDEVEIQRIKSNTEKELEIEKMNRADAKEKEEKAEAKEKELEEKEKNYKKSGLGKITMAMVVISIIAAVIGFSDFAIIGGIVALIQAGLFLVSWLMGARVIPEKKHNLHLLLAIVAFILIVPVCILIDNGDPAIDLEDKSVEYEWPDSGLATMLPKPETIKGKISYNYEDSFCIDVYGVSDEEYKAYVKACKEKGFTLDTSGSDDSYYAYNEDEYYLSLMHFDGDLTIRLEAPEPVKDFKWPTIGLATLVPEPPLLKGSIITDETYSFKAKIVEVDEDMFNAYVDKCIETGYSEDYSRSDTRFNAKDASGNSLTIDFDKTFSNIIIDFDPTDETETTTQKQEKTTAKNSSETVDYKEFWDSYEAFMDQYVEFMKSYDSSNPLALVEYGKLMKEYAEFTKKADARKDEEMSNEEAAYALEVESRVANKLLSIG